MFVTRVCFGGWDWFVWLLIKKKHMVAQAVANIQTFKTKQQFRFVSQLSHGEDMGGGHEKGEGWGSKEDLKFQTSDKYCRLLLNKNKELKSNNNFKMVETF